MRLRSFAFALAAFALPTLALGQRVSGGPELDRTATTVVVSAESGVPLAAVSITYGQSTWRAHFEGQMDAVKGTNYSQLGKGWWTTFDTVGAVEIGGVTVEAGSYYLGIRFAKDGAMSLLFFDSKQVMKDALLPATTALYTGEKKPLFTAPMAFARSANKDVATKLAIAITANEKDPSKGTLVMRWGPFEATATVGFQVAGAKAAGEAKK
jgi:hypothetical protein